VHQYPLQSGVQDSGTSKKAVDAIGKSASFQKRCGRILFAIAEDSNLVSVLGLHKRLVAPRLSEMAHIGLIESGPEKRTAPGKSHGLDAGTGISDGGDDLGIGLSRHKRREAALHCEPTETAEPQRGTIHGNEHQASPTVRPSLDHHDPIAYLVIASESPAVLMRASPYRNISASPSS
jgi:hypothetical protein